MTESYLRIAAQYANRTHNVELAQRVLQLAQQKRQNFGEEDEEQQSVFGLVAQPVNSFNAASRLVEYCGLHECLWVAGLHGVLDFSCLTGWLGITPARSCHIFYIYIYHSVILTAGLRYSSGWRILLRNYSLPYIVGKLSAPGCQKSSQSLFCIASKRCIVWIILQQNISAATIMIMPWWWNVTLNYQFVNGRCQ